MRSPFILLRELLLLSILAQGSLGDVQQPIRQQGRQDVLCSAHSHSSRGSASLHSQRHNGRHSQRRRHLHRSKPSPQSWPAYNSSCGPECSKHGVCNEELQRCDCPRHRQGVDCSSQAADLQTVCAQNGLQRSRCFEESPTLCLNQCNQRGRCITGYCHCQPGFWGSDCALSMDVDGQPELLAGQGYIPRQRLPRIYVYELPPELNLWYSTARLDRPLFLLFWQQLLSSGVRTADGEAADYYFMPIRLRAGGDSVLALKAIDYVRSTWPWWDKHGGGRHIFIQTGDTGRAESNRELLAVTDKSIWLTHWGLTHDNTYAGWPASHRPGLDIVVPIFLQPSLVRSYGMYRSPLHPAANHSSIARKEVFFFAGRVCGNRQKPVPNTWPNCLAAGGLRDGYSSGTRQLVHYHHSNRTGYKVVVSSRTYAQDMATHKFCLAPTGGGHGKRNVLVTMMGCIPVTITDDLLQPFEPELDWSKFSVAVPEAHIPDLHRILEDMPLKVVQSYQRQQHCGAQHVFWSTTHGSIIGETGSYDAFHTVLEILRARLAHPGVLPEQLASLDTDLRRFMACELHAPAKTPEVAPDLCSRSELHTSAFPCAECRKQMNQNFLLPGGAICCNVLKLAQCPRVWE